jgi:short-subunit dehydrogenase
MIQNGHDTRASHAAPAKAVAIVTGACTETGGDVARGLAGRDFAIVVVYLEHVRRAEVTIADILAAHGTTVAVRADLADDLDVQRLFAESIAAFGGVDAVVHTTTASASLLYHYAARHLRERGAIVSVDAAESIAPVLGRRLRERDITVGRAPPEQILSFLEGWRRSAIG